MIDDDNHCSIDRIQHNMVQEPCTAFSEVFAEFKFHLLHKSRSPPPALDNGFARLLASMQATTTRKAAMKTRLLAQRPRPSSTCQTQNSKLSSCRRNTLQNRSTAWMPQSDAITLVEEKILLQAAEKERLIKAVASLEASQAHLKQLFNHVKHQLDQGTVVQAHFHNLSFLGQSVTHQTNALKHASRKNFHRLIRHHDGTMSRLHTQKASHSTLLNNLLQQEIIPVREKKTNHKQPQTPSPKYQSMFKHCKSFFDHLHLTITLLKEKQPQFQSYFENLPQFNTQDRPLRNALFVQCAETHQAIASFEDKHLLRLQNAATIAEKCLEEIKETNDKLEKRCLELHQYKNTLIQELKGIKKIAIFQLTSSNSINKSIKKETNINKSIQCAHIQQRIYSTVFNIFSKINAYYKKNAIKQIQGFNDCFCINNKIVTNKQLVCLIQKYFQNNTLQEVNDIIDKCFLDRITIYFLPREKIEQKATFPNGIALLQSLIVCSHQTFLLKLQQQCNILKEVLKKRDKKEEYIVRNKNKIFKQMQEEEQQKQTNFIQSHNTSFGQYQPAKDKACILQDTNTFQPRKMIKLLSQLNFKQLMNELYTKHKVN